MANGLFAGGDGTELNPFLIEDAHDLNAIRNNLVAHYKLINDINLNVAPYNEGEGWIPIGKFLGGLNGDGHSIKHLYININTVGNKGLFLEMAGSTSNIKLDDVHITSTNSGVVDLIGAITGRLSGVIRNSCATGIIQSDGGRVGGLVGQAQAGSVVNSYTNCQIVGGTAYTAGFMAYVGVSISKCFSISVITGEGAGFGATSGASTSKSFWDKEVSGKTNNAGGAVGLTTHQMKTAKTFIDAGWSEELNDEGNPVWILEDGKYPQLWFEVDTLFLIKSNNKYYSYKDNIFIEVDLTEANFKAFGVNLTELLTPNIQGIEPLMTLDNPEIVLLTDKENPKLHIEGFRDLRPLCESDNQKLLINKEQTTSPVIKIKSIPKGQLILPTKDIYFRMLSNIQSFTVSTAGDITGIIRLIFSVNSGSSWQALDSVTGQFKILDNIEDLNEVKAEGMTIETFNSIVAKWNEVIKGMSVRFGYYLEIDEMNDIANVDKLEVIMDVLGSWEAIIHELDYDYEYDNEKIYIELYRDGSYKINYVE